MAHTTRVTLGSRIAIAGEGLGLFKGKSIVAAIEDLLATVTVENYGTGIEVKYGHPFTDTNPSLDIVGAVVRTLRKKHCGISDVRVLISSNVPMGQGLASSGVLFCAVTQCFNDHFVLGFTKDEIAHIAWEAERIDQGVVSGKFDQFPILYRGVLLQDFSQDPIRILRLELPKDTVVVLGTTGISSSYREVGEFIKRKFDAGDSGVIAYRDTMRTVVEDLVAAIKDKNMSSMGRLISVCHDAIRQQLGIKNEEIDELVRIALQHGAYAAKSCGIRFQGGSMFALCTPTEAGRVADALTKKGAKAYITRIAYPST